MQVSSKLPWNRSNDGYREHRNFCDAVSTCNGVTFAEFTCSIARVAADDPMKKNVADDDSE